MVGMCQERTLAGATGRTPEAIGGESGFRGRPAGVTGMSGDISETRRPSAFLLGHRQGEAKYGASWLVGFDPQPAAMGLDNGPADRQAHAHTVGLG